MTQSQPNEELVRMARVIALTGSSRSSVYAMAKRGEFPRPLKIGGRSLWVLSEVQAWIRRQVIERPRSMAPQLPLERARWGG